MIKILFYLVLPFIFLDPQPVEDWTFDGVVIGQNVRVRSMASTSGKVLWASNTGDTYKILGQSKDRHRLTKGDICDDYGWFWYKVVNIEGKEGWIYGKFLFPIQENADAEGEVYGRPYQISGQTFYLGRVFDAGYGASDEGGLTGCDELFMPFFFRPGEPKVFPIVIPGREGLDMKQANWGAERFNQPPLLLPANSEGGASDIEEVKTVSAADNSVATEIHVTIGYQEGGDNCRFAVHFKNGAIKLSYLKCEPMD